MEGISIVICTRNRPDSLYRCITSISNQRNMPNYLSYEVLVIDDGELAISNIELYRQTLGHVSMLYYKKNNPGLLLSRIESLSKATYDVLLFLDDDVELDECYIFNLYKIYKQYPTIAGVGGVDILLHSSAKWRLFSRFFLYNSGDPGKLSVTGYGGSMVFWNNQRAPFITEFLSGCNMSFKKTALSDLMPLNQFTNYSLGEDIYLSFIARKTGKLMIDPMLRVKHNCSPIARDRKEHVAFTEVVNHHYLLLLAGANKWKMILHFWTIAGFCLGAILSNRIQHLKGYIRGVMYLFSNRW